MKRFAYISSFFLILSLLLVGEVAAQLITDSDRRLKTQKSKGQPSSSGPRAPSQSPFQAFRNKQSTQRRAVSTSPFSLSEMKQSPARSASGERDRAGFFQSGFMTPRYSAGSPFRNQKYKSTAPRYSMSQIWSKDDLSRSPRYSSSSIWTKKDYSQAATRYSSPQIWSKNDLARSPRYSSPQIWSKQDLSRSPRYSSSQIWSKKDLARSPRYSSPHIWSKNDLTKSPRYSSPHIWSKNDLAKSPRYSVGSPFSNYKFKAAPRYSPQQQWANTKFATPRYSVADPYKGYKYSSPRYSANVVWPKELMRQKQPRYSSGQPFEAKDYNATPRYSVNVDWPKKLMNNKPRYSPSEVDWPRKLMKNEPRYSPGNAYDGYKWANLPPRYSTNENRFKDNSRAKRENRIVEYEAPFFSGETKIRWKRDGDMHPSYNHHYATQSIEVIRDGMRQWNIYWVRVAGNQEDPKGVKEKVLKPKFDKKEAEIWND